jgi:hypothetical protein
MDINDNMSIQKAFDILEILLDDNMVVNKEYVKKRYHKLALKWHPDKNKDVYAKEKFQLINEAYEYLLIEFFCDENINSDTYVSSSDSDESKMYINILSGFVSSLFHGSYNDILLNVIKEISLGYETVTLLYLRKKCETLDKQKVIELYHLLYKYKHILYISDETLELVSLVIREKYKNDKIYILQPCLEDMMEHKIYKLYVDEQLYLVPLWHNELYFDGPDGTEIIVLCQPKLPTNVTIDENNNIYYEKYINVNTELIDLMKTNKFVSLEIGGKLFSIPLDKLYIKDEQIYKFKSQGISKIVEKYIYNIINKADIIVKIILV